ncbi:MAG: dTDP-4-dehydrorhamnose reductase [Congregibacter sp.]
MADTSLRVVITGAAGQLGMALVDSAPAQASVRGVSRQDCDISDRPAVLRVLDEVRPDLLINAAAYTAVDKAEKERDAAFAANAHAPEILARACAERGVRMLHVSTDFVFDGAASRPYAVDATPKPLGVYGESKLAGERAVAASGVDYLIMRTGWVYSHRGKNFFRTMLGLHSDRDILSVVADQVGTPTRAESLAQALWSAAALPRLSGVYHWSDAGVCSWYDFAQAIGEEAVRTGVLRSAAQVLPIRSEDYPTPAHRPSYSVLDKTRSWHDLEITPMHWRDGLQRTLMAYRETDGG